MLQFFNHTKVDLESNLSVAALMTLIAQFRRAVKGVVIVNHLSHTKWYALPFIYENSTLFQTFLIQGLSNWRNDVSTEAILRNHWQKKNQRDQSWRNLIWNHGTIGTHQQKTNPFLGWMVDNDYRGEIYFRLGKSERQVGIAFILLLWKRSFILAFVLTEWTGISS